MRQGLANSNLENHWTLKDEQDLSFAPTPKSSFMQRFAFWAENYGQSTLRVVQVR
jgi:hypothetical protein